MHRTHKTTTTLLLLLTCMFAAAQAIGCVSKDSGALPDAGSVRPDAADNTPTGTHHQYVFDQFTVPSDQTQAQALALDLDGAGGGDNKLGEILSVLGDLGGQDIQANVNAQIARGEMLILANLQATALDSAQATGLWVFRGDVISPSPCLDDDDTVCAQHLDGGGTFGTVGATDSSLIYGDISDGILTGGPGRVTLRIPLVIVPQPLIMNLVAVRVNVEVGATGLSNGRLGGAVTVDEINDNILPQLVVVMQNTTQQDCTGVSPNCCTPGSQGEDLVGTFDSDGSCDITLEELQDNALLSGLLSPDLDLFDAEGFFVPNDDGVKDSLSLGVGFNATLGTFELPPSINP